LLIYHKIFASMIVWMFVSGLVALGSGVDALVPMALIGILVARELTEGLLTKAARKRFGAMILAGTVLFSIVVANRVWPYVS
jgi:hypothetical protein